MIDLKQLLIDRTQYESGFKLDTDKYVISASMVADEPMEIFLKILYGVREATEFTAATFGTIMHKGLEIILDEEPDNQEITYWETEVPNYEQIDSDWYLSGTADLIYNEDGTIHIVDHKTTKSYLLQMLEKEGKTHRYALQLAALKAINFTHYDDEKKKGHLLLFIKDDNAIKKIPAIKQLEVDTLGSQELRDWLLPKLKIVQEHIENATVPEECSDLWWRKIKGENVPMRCVQYCAYNDVCPHYKKRRKTSTVTAQLNW